MGHLWPQLVRAAVALQARLELCPNVDAREYDTHVVTDTDLYAHYVGKAYITNDYYIVVARRTRHAE